MRGELDTTQLLMFINEHSLTILETQQWTTAVLLDSEKRLPASQIEAARWQASQHSLDTILEELTIPFWRRRISDDT